MYLSYGCPVLVSERARSQVMRREGVSQDTAECWIEREVVASGGSYLVPDDGEGGMEAHAVIVAGNRSRFVVELRRVCDRTVLYVLELLQGSTHDAAWKIQCARQRHLSRTALDAAYRVHWCGPLLQPTPVCGFFTGPLRDWGILGRDTSLLDCAYCQEAHRAWLKRSGLPDEAAVTFAPRAGADGR